MKAYAVDVSGIKLLTGTWGLTSGGRRQIWPHMAGFVAILVAVGTTLRAKGFGADILEQGVVSFFRSPVSIDFENTWKLIDLSENASVSSGQANWFQMG